MHSVLGADTLGYETGGGYYTLAGKAFVSGCGYLLGTAMDELAQSKHEEQVFEIH